ncbi:MAG TPA: YncE family protein [Polyangiaceae bacterium]|nr:YncE family protein [Polyangiaceae bacterium]
MSARGLARLVTLAGLGALASACTRDAPAVVYEPYSGPPVFPERRAPLPAVSGELGLVSNAGSDTITAIDVGRGEVLATVPVGRDPVDLDGPHHVALDRARGFAYVALSYPATTASSGPHASHGGSVRLGVVQKLRLSDLRVVGEARVDPNPGDIVLSDDGRRLVVTHFDLTKATAKDVAPESRRATLAVLDPEALTLTGAPEPVRIPVCAAPHGLALSRPAGDVAYVACYGDDAVAVVDLREPSAAPVRVPLGPGAQSAPSAPVYGPYSVALSPSGKELLVANLESKDVRVFDAATRAPTGRVFPTQGAPYFPVWSEDEAELFVPTQAPDGVRVLDARTGAVKRQRALDARECASPHEAVLAGDGAVWLVCEGDRKSPSVVLSIDRDTLATRRSLAVGVYPDRLIVRGPK